MAWSDESAFPMNVNQDMGLTKREYAAMHIASAMMRLTISDGELKALDLMSNDKFEKFCRVAWSVADGLEHEK